MVSYSQSFAQLIFDIDYIEASKSTRVDANLFGIFVPNNLLKTERYIYRVDNP